MTKAAGTGCMRPLENLLSGAACPIAFIEQHWLLEVKEQLQEKGVVMLTQGLAHPRSPLLDTELQQSKQTAMS